MIRKFATTALALVAALAAGAVVAQPKKAISIATGGTGGVY